jgi:hypothetical protein
MPSVLVSSAYTRKSSALIGAERKARGESSLTNGTGNKGKDKIIGLEAVPSLS